MTLSRVALVPFLVMLFAFTLPGWAYASPGSSCTGIQECASSGEACINHVCRTTCTSNSSACTGDTVCQLYTSASSVKICLPPDTAPLGLRCDPACASYQTCTNVGGVNRCVNNQNQDGTFQTSTNHPDASANSSATGGGLKNPLKAGSLTELVAAVLHGVVQIGAILLVLALVWVGFLFVAAQGAEEKIRDARNALLWTVIGGLLLLGAEAIARVIGATVEAL